ncbi:MAG TPA: helix-turn-helix transcriptional regulator [Candidatus Brachybacterium merdavium]|uniref:Helix-turn-helix transcriptional regulator n=1 Tax=Candidatus Brachybacterium merdavium TaxID=2838513 RepID=A0A9D2LAH0_9MICO|nr:helix-turn-helix transcriptional regulator [Candidatus Brachybacterium merdavium]
MDTRREAAQFLTTARGRISPEQAGVPVSGGQRRVPGLRREEIAELAGVSTAYYTRIERGDLRGVSDSVLESLARALRLDRAERAHLQDLARAAAGRSGLPEGGEGTGDQGPVVPPRVHQLIETMGDVPVIAGNHLRDSLAANALGRALFPDLFPEDGPALNTAEYMFLDERARRFYPDWETTARNAVSNLRLTAGRRPGDPDLRALIERLRAGSSEFRTWWDGHTVRVHDHGTKTIDHPQVGRLTLSYEVLDIPSVPGVTLASYLAEPGTPDADALDLLRNLVSNPGPRAVADVAQHG